MQAEKAKLEGDLAALQVKLDTREVQLQDAVRQLNISKFMLSESDEARDEVWLYVHENAPLSPFRFATIAMCGAGSEAKRASFPAESKTGSQCQGGNDSNISILSCSLLSSNTVCHEA